MNDPSRPKATRRPVSARSTAFLAGLVLLRGTSAGQGDDRFVPGHVFVSEIRLEGCRFGEDSAVRVVDPMSGESWVLADQDDGICDPLGLLFTPEATHLRVANGSSNTIVDIDAKGRLQTVYDHDDGLRGPGLHNGMAFDRAGAFFVSNDSSLRILKFPVEGGGPLVFADVNDGITRGGGAGVRSEWPSVHGHKHEDVEIRSRRDELDVR